jgi:thioredoxin-dependent peroxiredoxin
MSRLATLAIVASLFVVALVTLSVRKLSAQLEHGAPAPEFTAEAAIGGEVRAFDLKAALAKGPVVLYFFPKSFTSGCTVEAHLFSEHIGDYEKLGATVIGVSGDDIETQKRFSTQECRSSFLVASDPGLKIAKTYDAALVAGFSNRTSYVIAPNGTIAYAYTNLDPSKHVENTLAALRRLATKQ